MISTVNFTKLTPTFSNSSKITKKREHFPIHPEANYPGVLKKDKDAIKTEHMFNIIYEYPYGICTQKFLLFLQLIDQQERQQ